ncbi:MAG: hypothetical protein HZB41_13625 [Ignavibacteriae bacterium]|nr:hypothetical protein [Ignavibacteriota bacterium]
MLILITVFHICGFCFVFVLVQKSHRKYIKNIIRKELTQTEILKFSKYDLNSKKIHIVYVKEDEIRYNNSMYDIVSVKETTDSIYINCINDKEEEKLIANYLDNENKSDSNNNQSIYKNLKPFSVFVLNEFKKNHEFYSIKILQNENGSDFYNSIPLHLCSGKIYRNHYFMDLSAYNYLSA